MHQNKPPTYYMIIHMIVGDGVYYETWNVGTQKATSGFADYSDMHIFNGYFRRKPASCRVFKHCLRVCE